MDSTNSNETSADDVKVKDDLFNLVEKQLRIELHKKDEELQAKDEELTKEKEEKQKLSAELSRLNLSHINTAMDSSTQTSADDAKHTCICSKLFDLSEKLGIELHKKDEELHKREQEKEKLSTDLALEKAQSDQLKTELDNAQEMIEAHQMSWEFFPCDDLYYYIETHSGSSNGGFLAESGDNYLRSANGQHRDIFKFTKNSDGTFSIYRMVDEDEEDSSSSQEKYLHTNTDSDSSRVKFTANKNNPGKFVLILHQQNHHIGLLVDICTLDGYFLCMDNDGYVVANSRTPPAPTDKFMITVSEF